MALWLLELAQDGFKLAQVGSKLGPSWLQVGSIGPKIGSGRLLEALLKGPGESREGPGGTWSQVALLEAPEVPKRPPADSKIDEKSIKSTSDLRALASE